MNWIKLDKKQADDVIQRVIPSNQAGMFPCGFTEVKCFDLSFYKHYKLYRLINIATLPTFTMDFLSNGNKFVHIDGSADCLGFIDGEKELDLNVDNALEYLNFYYRQVYNADGDIYVISDMDDAPFFDSLDESQQANIKRHYKSPEVIISSEGILVVKAVMFYEGGLVDAEISINKHEGVPRITQHRMLLNDSIHAYWREGYHDLRD